jgi:hypothetical protein
VRVQTVQDPQVWFSFSCGFTGKQSKRQTG